MPVYTHLAIEYAALGIGSRIREQRKKRGWTLQQFAQRLGVAISRLSAVETEKLALDIDLFLAIVRALDVPIDVLLPPSATRHFNITRRDAIDASDPSRIRIVVRARGGLMSYHNRLWPLAQPFVGKHIEPYAIRIEPVRDQDLRFISHHHEEFFFLLQGRVECLIKTPDGILSEKISAGDCMYFWSYLPHVIRSTSREPALSINLVHSPHEAADSELTTDHGGEMYLIDASHKNVNEQIAGRITLLRQAHAMSFADFSRALGVTVRRLKHIEQGRTPISLELLLNICRRFRKPREYFLASTLIQRPFAFVLRSSEIRSSGGELPRNGRGVARCFGSAAMKPLAAKFPGRGMHPYLVRLHGNHRRPLRMRPHHGQEFVYVLKGAVKLHTRRDGQQYEETLYPGDSCFVDATAPHQFSDANLHPYDRGGSEIVAVLWIPRKGA